MAIEILLTIPDEFDNEFVKNQFSESLQRLSADANTLAGDYEKETAAMLIEAFKNSKWTHVMPNELEKENKQKAANILDKLIQCRYLRYIDKCSNVTCKYCGYNTNQYDTSEIIEAMKMALKALEKE